MPTDKHTKEALDKQTSYLTFLPPMEEGFHTGYHASPGVVSDRNRRPREWLESLARSMATPGSEVGYSIPDVLASEQQLRRLMRLHPEETRHNQQMTDHRAVLALLLLWDTFDRDESWPVLELRHFKGEQTAFSGSVTAALTPARVADGLRVFVLRSTNDAGLERPIALISHAAAIVPAAEMGDLSALLPPCITWYDREAKRFADPSRHMNAALAQLLNVRLRILQTLCEEPQYHSPLYAADAQLGGVIARFAQDLTKAHEGWLTREALRTRILAMLALPVEKQTLALNPPTENPLLQVLGGDMFPADAAEPLVCYTFEGVPFAVPSPETLLMPMYTPEEANALSRMEAELSLYAQHDVDWRSRTAQALRRLHAENAHRTGLHPSVADWISEWADELDSMPVAAQREMTLDQPLSAVSGAVRALTEAWLGLCDETLLRCAFSDMLLLWEDGGHVPPLSPELCAWLMEHDEVTLEAHPPKHTREGYAVSLRLTGPSGSVILRRYVPGEEAVAGAALQLSKRPTIAAWPNVRFAPGLWKAYYLFTHQPNGLTVCAPSSNGWTQEARHLADADVLFTDLYPAYVPLLQGRLTAGALINTAQPMLIKHEPAAAIAIDFGSTATTVMLRQGEAVQPASLPRCLHCTLLEGTEDASSAMADCFLPEGVLLPDSPTEATYFSLMDMFTDDHARWNSVLQDGHIFYRTTVKALEQKHGALYSDLKWSEEPYAQRVLRLFLKQVMLQAALSARMRGSSSASWRVSMPNAMPLHRQEAYLEMMRGLARELAAETGLPLTPGLPPVLYASENHADGLYFLGRSEINAQSGYLNLDVGGSTADLSLWLNGQPQPVIDCSLLLGCRQMLAESLLERHADLFETDFDDESLCPVIRQITASRHHRQLLLDNLIASHFEELCAAMAQCRALGRISYLESLLLFHFGFLFYLAGEMLERARLSQEAPLPERMEICIAGNGGQLLNAFDEEQRARLCSLALARLDRAHPLKVLLPVQSRQPKQEVARGLLYDDACLHSSIQGAQAWNGTSADLPTQVNLAYTFLPLFRHVFPQAAQRLMPRAFEESSGDAFTPTAAMELSTIIANEAQRAPEDDMAMYVRCLASLKRVWRI